MALPLVAAPILLHLFDRRRNVVIEWGAMQFLMEAAARKTSARRVQHWLLLLLRAATLAILIFALARPVLPGHWFGNANHQETIIVLDNSLSTARTVDDKSIFDGLRQRAEDTLDALKAGGQVRILLTSPYPVWVTPTSLQVNGASRADLHDQLLKLQPTQGTSDLQVSLLKAVQSEFDASSVQTRRIVLLTDGQRGDWRTDDRSGWSHFRETLTNALIPTIVEFPTLETADHAAGNIAVNRLRVNRNVIGTNEIFTLTAEVQNYSADSVAARNLVWSVDGESQAESPLHELAAGETHDVVWKHTFQQPGVFTLSCRVEADDQLQADNNASMVVEVVDRVPVLLVESSAGFAEMQQDAYLVRAALGHTESGNAADNASDTRIGGGTSWQAVFQPRTVSPQELETVDLNQFRVVVIPNLAGLGSAAVTRLTDFVNAGGGLWLAVGPRTDVQEFNRLLFNDGDGLSPLQLDQPVDEANDELRTTTINPLIKQHPAMLDLADNERLDTADVKVTRRFRFQSPREVGHVSVLLDLSNGDPLVVENRFGAGRVILQAVPLRLQWSDLATSQAFVVMVHDWLGYLSAPGATRYNLQPGEPITVRLPRTAGIDATLSTPEGDDVGVTGEPVEGGIEFRTSRTAQPGTYRLEVGVSGDGIPFHVIRESAESDLTPLTDADRDFLQETALFDADQSHAATSNAKAQHPIWPGLLILLIMFMVIELLISGGIARGRFGTQAISETGTQLPTAHTSFSTSPAASPGSGPVTSVASQPQTIRTEKQTSVS